MSRDQRYPSQTLYQGSPQSPARKRISQTKSISPTLQGHSQRRLSNYNKYENSKDNTLALLRGTIYEGWPNSLLLLFDFSNFREDLTIEDGIILKCDRIILPPTLKPDILITICQGHLGVDKCVLRAWYAVYWPRITNDVTQFVSQCEDCRKHQKKKRKRKHYYN